MTKAGSVDCSDHLRVNASKPELRQLSSSSSIKAVIVWGTNVELYLAKKNDMNNLYRGVNNEDNYNVSMRQM